MDEKVLERIKKLQALAERGVGGEKTTAQKKLQKLLEDNNITSLEELLEDKQEYYLFSYNGNHERRLLFQIMYKVLGASSDRTYYRSKGTRNKIGIYCTKVQKMEIDLDFEFYRNVFYEELDVFIGAFIQSQKLFPSDAPPAKEYNVMDERDMKMAAMASNIDKRTRSIMIENKEGIRF